MEVLPFFLGKLPFPLSWSLISLSGMTLTLQAFNGCCGVDDNDSNDGGDNLGWVVYRLHPFYCCQWFVDALEDLKCMVRVPIIVGLIYWIWNCLPCLICLVILSHSSETHLVLILLIFIKLE